MTSIRTVEVFVRGFLLGFGTTLLKDLLLDGRRDDGDVQKSCQHAKYIGLGMGCALVGMSVMIPTRLQEWAMQHGESYY